MVLKGDSVFKGGFFLMKETLCQNNYPENITSATINLDHKTEEDSRKLTTVCLTYVSGLAEKIQKI